MSEQGENASAETTLPPEDARGIDGNHAKEASTRTMTQPSLSGDGGRRVQSDKSNTTLDHPESLTPEFAEEGALTDAEMRALYRQACEAHRLMCEALATAKRRVATFESEMIKRKLFVWIVP
jgi:hypothetical protein